MEQIMNTNLLDEAKDAIENLSRKISQQCHGENSLVVVVSCIEIIESAAYVNPELREAVYNLYKVSKEFIESMPAEPEVVDAEAEI